MNKSLKKVKNIISADRYYKMTTEELEQEASKYKIGEYAENMAGRTIVRRRLIIEQLLAKDLANNSRFAVFLSILALIISIVSVFISVVIKA